jgi:hypothetical protein
MTRLHYHLNTDDGLGESLGDCLSSQSEADEALQAEVGRLSLAAARDGHEAKFTEQAAGHFVLRIGLHPLELGEYEFTIVQCRDSHDRQKEGVS